MTAEKKTMGEKKKEILKAALVVCHQKGVFTPAMRALMRAGHPAIM